MRPIFHKFGFLAILMAGSFVSQAQFSEIQYLKKNDQTGRNTFETSKVDSVGYTGQKMRIGAGFTQTFQTLGHSNTPYYTIANDGTKTLSNGLLALQSNFGLASANMTFDAQLADGIRLNLTMYLAARHHNDTWVKGGYIQIDKIPFWHSDLLDRIMEYTTVRVGHFEINYGDAHFRRTDNGNAILNPFAENLIMDSFATEIAAEVEVKSAGWLGVLGLSNGLIKGDVIEKTNTVTNKRVPKNPSLYGKFGYDNYIMDGWRLRLTQSAYYNGGSASNTLYAGDRGGSNYWGVMLPANVTDLTASGNFTSGRYSPGFSYQVTSLMTNLFTKFQGLEVFGTYEHAKGRSYTNAATQLDKRSVNQYAADVLYYFGAKENFFLGMRYNLLKGELATNAMDAKITRLAGAAGYFFTKNILLKAEYVSQKYNGFPAHSILDGGKFDGFVVSAVVGF